MIDTRRGSLALGGVCRALLFLSGLAVVFTILVPATAMAAPGDEYVFGADSHVASDPDDPQQTPALSGEGLVWQGRYRYGSAWRYRIQYKDISNPENPVYTLVPKNSSGVSQSEPAISGGLVVWLEGGTTKQIHYTFLDGGCPGSCADNVLPIGNLKPQAVTVRGHKIVFVHEVSSSNTDIFLYDLDNPGAGAQPVTTAPGKQTVPRLSDAWVAYYDVNTSTVRARPAAGGSERSAEGNNSLTLSGDRLCYTRAYMGQPNVGVWYLDLSNPNSEPEQLHDKEANRISADAENSERVVWESTTRHSGDQEIYLHDLPTGVTQRVSVSPSTTLYPVISANHVVWSDDRDGVRNLYQNRLGEKASEMAARYKPELYIWADDYVPTLVDAITDVHFGETQTRFRKWHNGQVVEETSAFGMISNGSLATFTETNPQYPRSEGWDFDLDLWGSRTDGDRHINDWRYWRNEYLGGQKTSYPATIYARVARDLDIENGNRKTAIQYWMCYYYNDVPAKDDLKHEGDWEMVQVSLDEQLAPETAIYSQHSGGEKREWQDVGKTGDQPKVYVAGGTHANKFLPGRQIGSDIADWEDASSDPIIEDPDLRMIDYPATGWLSYFGWWGESDSAPRGPIFNDIPSWNNPLDWGGKFEKDAPAANDTGGEACPVAGGDSGAAASSTLFAADSGSLTDGLLVNFYDSQERRTGKDELGTVYEEIPGSEYLSWSDGGGTAIIHDSDIGLGYRVEVESQGPYTFTLELNLPQFAQGQLDIPVYEVSIPGPLAGRVVVAPAGSPQDFTMYLDTNGDGLFDDGTVTPSNTPQIVDYQAPAQIIINPVVTVGPGSATIDWIAPGDDGVNGTASLYEIRYSTSAITDEYGWTHADPVLGEPAPQPAGSPETFSIEGLPSGTYYFAIRAVDDVGLESDLSNTVSAVVPPYQFIDDFNDGDAQGWSAEPPDDWSTVGSQGSYGYQANTVGRAAAWTGPANLCDQVVEADVRILSGSAAGIILRGDGDIGSGSYIYFGIYPGEGKWKLFDIVGGDWTGASVAEGDFTLDYDTSYRLKAAAQDDQISLFIDEQPLLGESLTLPSHPWGRFGLAADSAVAQFDNVSVQQEP